ncbi:TPA: ATP-binding protein [Clostridium perfringens]|nr:ATP-binding protein [Clostridium perfringens]
MIKGYKSQLMDMYEKIRQKEKSNLANRQKELKEKLPQVFEYEREINKLSLKLSMLALRKHEKESFEKLKKEIENLRDEKNQLLAMSGYPKDYLDMHYICPSCKDTGYIGTKKCICYKKKLVYIYYENSHMADALKLNNFSKFDINVFSPLNNGNEKYSPRENMQIIIDKMVNGYIPKFDTHNENILFYGSPGTGKTFLTYCIAKELLDNGFLVVYRTSDELIRNLREIRFNNDHELEDLLINCDLLVIDDLGAEQITDFSTTELFTLLNKKILLNKKMIISTNLNLPELKQAYAERITSRLLGNFLLFKTYGDDIRIKKNLQKRKNTPYLT